MYVRSLPFLPSPFLPSPFLPSHFLPPPSSPPPSSPPPSSLPLPPLPLPPLPLPPLPYTVVTTGQSKSPSFRVLTKWGNWVWVRSMKQCTYDPSTHQPTGLIVYTWLIG